MSETLHNAPIVLDNGSGTIRAGFAGEDLPKCYFPSFVGRPKHTRVLAGALEGDVFIGQKAQELRGLLKIRYPLEHGIVTDWDDMERIWQYVYTEELKTLSEEVRMNTGMRNPASMSTDFPNYIPKTPRLTVCSRLVASSATDRTSPKPSIKSRDGSSDTLRDVQCTSTLQFHPSRSLTLCFWPHNRDCPRCRRWSFACSTSLWRLRDAKQHPQNWRGWKGRYGIYATLVPEKWLCLSH